jgi:hypothetical protein
VRRRRPPDRTRRNVAEGVTSAARRITDQRRKDSTHDVLHRCDAE